MRTVQGLRDNLYGLLIKKMMPGMRSPEEHKNCLDTVEEILELLSDEMTRTLWKNLRDEYLNKNKNV